MLRSSRGFTLAENAFPPSGDQPEAIEKLVRGVLIKKGCQTLLGVTGSGKTFTIANVIARTNKNTLVISHNKTLLLNYMQNSRSFFQIITLDILSASMTIINLKAISHRLIIILKKILKSMKELKKCDWKQLQC